MDRNELFIDSGRLPNKLTKEELRELFIEYKNGSLEARQKIIIHNIKLVIYVVLCKLEVEEYDRQELIAVGNIGLIKAVDTFDFQKGYDFSTYAAVCIKNEILIFLRKQSKDQTTISLDRGITNMKEGNKVRLVDTLKSDIDVNGDVEKADILDTVKKLVYKLPIRDSEIMLLHFGFYDGVMHSQRNIANILNLSASTVSRAINKNVDIIGRQLDDMGLINLPSTTMDGIKAKDNYLNSSKNSYKMMPLLEEEQLLIDMWKNFQLRSLAQSNGTVKEEKIEFTAEHYLDILKELREPKFRTYLQLFTVKESIILLLKMGYFDDRCFTDESVAAFFKLTPQEFKSLTIRALEKYREAVYKIMRKSFNKQFTSDDKVPKTV